MPNELWWLIFLAVDFGLSLLAIYYFGKNGLYVIIAADIIICNLQVIKTVEIFGLVATLGNILYGSIFLATDLLSEVYGKKEARKGIWMGFYALIFMTISMQLALQFKPHSSDFSSEAMQTIFGFLPRITLASIIAYTISQNHDIWAFHFWKKITGNKYLWLRNNASTLVSQAIDSSIFVFIAFLGVFEWSILLSILLTTYLIKILVALLDTPIIYLGKWVLSRHERNFQSQN
jgi:uncharacterized integral membrane protein (TIGR00697 family)